MIQTIVQSPIPSPAGNVYSYVADLETMINYNSSVKSAKWETPEKRQCRISISLSFLNINGIYKITEIIPNKKITAVFNHDTLDFTDIYEFQDTDGGCILKIEDRMTLKGLLSLSEGILKPILKKEMENNLKTLIKNLEKS